MEEKQKNLGNAETEYKSQMREKSHWPVLESQLKACKRVSTTSIKLKAFSIAKQEKFEISNEATSGTIGLCIEISLVYELLLRLVIACL